MSQWHYRHHHTDGYLYSPHTRRHAHGRRHFHAGHHAAHRGEDGHRVHHHDEQHHRGLGRPHRQGYRQAMGEGAGAVPASAQAYAAPESPNPLGQFFSDVFGHHGTGANGANPPPGVAVYNISAGKVFLPGRAEPLEAHSGVGPGNYDSPGSVNKRLAGATPPGLYNLSPREGLFHGVEALRLTPANGKYPFGRDGFLAHPYMLRNAPVNEPGASEGCPSFKDYNAFLHEYRAGHIRQLLVIPGDKPAPGYRARHDDIPVTTIHRSGRRDDPGPNF